jgi:hypothetical protein
MVYFCKYDLRKHAKTGKYYMYRETERCLTCNVKKKECDVI